MDLRKRLSQLDSLTRRSTSGDMAPKPMDPARIGSTMADLGLEEEQTSAGPIWTRRALDPVPPPDSLPSFAGFFTHADAAQPHSGDLLFLDTETTGLAGGTGTIAFLVGASWWTDQGLATCQYFLSAPGQEPALLEALGELAKSFGVVVTFNGASFDLPLLRTRALMNRATDPLASLVSWDLLVPARRLRRRMLENCRQQTLEESVCGLPARTGDIDGAGIPAVWFEFLAGGGAGQLDRVLHHNHLDMLGMAHLFSKVVERASLVHQNAATVLAENDWREDWSLGRICENLKEQKDSIFWMRRALKGARKESSSGPDPRFLTDAIRILKRSGDWALVEDLITWGLCGSPSPQALQREAAILYERRLGDLEKALVHARLGGEDARVSRLLHKLALQTNDSSKIAKAGS